MSEDSSRDAPAASPGRTAATDGDTDGVPDGDAEAGTDDAGADPNPKDRTDDRVAISDGGELLQKPPVGDGGREEPDSDSDSDSDEEQAVTVDEPAGLIDTDLEVELEPEQEEERWRLDEEEVEVHGGTGPRRVVAERGVDEVFDTFEESTPEEVMAAASEQEADDEDAETDVAADPEVREDVERLLGDLSDVEEEEPSLDASELADRTGDSGGLFVEAGGHRRVVGESDPDAVFEEFEESTPEEVVAAAESDSGDDASEDAEDGADAVEEFGVDVPAADADADADATRESATTTEKPLQPRSTDQTMNVGRDRAGGGRPDEGASEGDGVDLESALAGVTFDDGGDDEGIGAFVDDSEETLVERADDDRHRAVGESDVDAVFEEFEESTPEEVMAAADADAESESEAEAEAAPGAGADADVEGLFGDLSGVDVEPAGEPDEPTYDTPDPDDPEATAAEIEGLMDDLATMEVDEDAESDVEAMFDELSGVEVPDPQEADVDVETGETTVETSLDTGPDTLEVEETGIDAFQWLGEDVHIFEPGEQAVDAVFEEFEESTPEEVMAADSPDVEDTSATGMYRSLGEDGSVVRAGSVPEPAGWERDGADVAVGVDVRATAMYDDIAGAGAPRVRNGNGAGTAPTPDPDGDGDDGDLDIDLDDPADDLDLEVPPADDAGGDDGGDDEIDLDLEDPADDVAIDLNDPETDASDQLDLDVPDPDTDDGADAGTTTADDDDGIELDIPDPEEVGDADPTADTDASSGATDAAGSGGSTTAQPTTDESDVDAVFERFEGDSPEEIVASADDPAAEAADDGVEIDDADVDRLFGDLSTVDLEASEPEPEPTPTGDVPEPGSEEAESEVEGLLDDLSTVDLEASEPEPEPESEPEETTAPEPTTAGPSVGAETADAGADGDVLERTGDDTHVAVGESDVDAVFERFEETSPEEIVEGFEFELGESTTSSDDFQFDVDADDDGDDFQFGVDEADATTTPGDDDTSPSVGNSPSASSTSTSTSTSTSASASTSPGSSTSSVGDEVLDDPEGSTTATGTDATTTSTDAGTTTTSEDGDETDRYSATDDGPGSEPLFPEVAEKADERDQRAEPDGDDDDDGDDGGIVSKITGVFSRILGVF